MNIQIDLELPPMIRDIYTQDVAEQPGHLRPSEWERLYAAGKITDAVGDS